MSYHTSPSLFHINFYTFISHHIIFVHCFISIFTHLYRITLFLSYLERVLNSEPSDLESSTVPLSSVTNDFYENRSSRILWEMRNKEIIVGNWKFWMSPCYYFDIAGHTGYIFVNASPREINWRLIFICICSRHPYMQSLNLNLYDKIRTWRLFRGTFSV